MKTNQVLVRKMGDFYVCQRTSDGFFNATELLTQWNKCNRSQKQVVHYTENSATSEFIKALLSEENLKERNSVLIQTRGKNGGTWMHPLLFIDFSMWLNPAFKVKVLKFVYDELIKYRNDAGDAYREMASAISKIVDRPLMQAAMKDIAKALNYIVYNNHEPMMRNKQADESLLREMVELEKDIVKLIHFGFIKTYESLKDYLRERWRQKWIPKVLTA